jgi:hypothetical protein
VERDFSMGSRAKFAFKVFHAESSNFWLPIRQDIELIDRWIGRMESFQRGLE